MALGAMGAVKRGGFGSAGHLGSPGGSPAPPNTLVAGTGSFILTGDAMTPLVDRKIPAAVGAFTLTGQDATLVKSGGTPFTWNPADGDSDITLANSNRDLTGGTQHSSIRTTAGKTSGLWYCEITIVSPLLAQPQQQLGIMNGTATVTNQYIGATASGGAYAWANQTSFTNGVTVANAIPATQNLSNGDIIQLAMNLSNGKVWLGQNNTWKTGDPAADTSPWLTFTVGASTWYFAAAVNSSNPLDLATLRLASTLTYSPPSGFTGINA